MKKIFYIGLLMLFAFSLKAQQGLDHYTYSATLDTITNTGTVTFTNDLTFDKLGYMGAYVYTTVLSGTGSGTISYQVAGRGTTDWYTVATDTIAASGTAYVDYTGLLYGQKFRITTTGVGTQSTKIDAVMFWKELK